MRRIAVIGSRNFHDYGRLKCVLQPWLPAHIISGGAKGTDSLAEKLALEHELPITVIKPDWKQYGRGAGPIRNREIVDTADVVIVFWNGKSKGTASAVNYARTKNKRLIVEPLDDL